MTGTKGRMRQVVDWSAAFWAGILAGIAFLLMNMALTASYVGSPWIVNRLIAALILGEGVLPPPATFTWGIFIVSVIVHLVLSVLAASLIATIFHRWGLLVGIIGGAVIGLAIYIVNFYALTFLAPWFFPMKSWIMLVSHVVFGALAGGIYELLEVEEYESDALSSEKV